MTQEELKQEVVSLRTKVTQLEGLRAAETAELRAEIADLKLQVERQKQQTESLTQQHGEFKTRTEPSLQESEKFRHKVEALAGLAKLFMGTATSLLLVLTGFGITEYSANRVRDEKLAQQEKRIAEIDSRTKGMQEGIEKNFKAINEALDRIEKAKKQ